MTRARALKKLIRARAAKTGERYTTARRHVFQSLQDARSVPLPPVPMSSPRSASRPAAAASSKGGLSDAKSREKTGHGLDHWFDVLDQFGGVDKGHTAAARHLYDVHGVEGWYAQGITVAYERARGVRAINQRRDGAYEVSVSKVLPVETGLVIKAFAEPRRRRQWTGDVDRGLVTALSAALDSPSSKRFVTKPNGQARLRYPWDGTIVEVYLLPKAGGKSSIVVVSKKLGSQTILDERRGQWRAALGALAASLVK
jgi:hypothetical protein